MYNYCYQYSDLTSNKVETIEKDLMFISAQKYRFYKDGKLKN